MFARSALRHSAKSFSTASFRSASTFSASAAEAMNPHGIEISKAQRIAQDGFVSGTLTLQHTPS